jgi:small subunit ribosomal protein S17
VVKITESVKHGKYSKILKRSVKFKVHDPSNECDVGDRVLIMETRPLSKDKHFRLVRIVEKVK